MRAWELKEDLRAVFRAGSAAEVAELLDDWMHRAAYCKIAKVVAAVELGIGNGRVEAINNKIKVTVRMGDRKSTRLNSSHIQKSRMPSSA